MSGTLPYSKVHVVFYPVAAYGLTMMTVIAILLFGSILACMGVLVKWELKRAKQGPRFNPKSLNEGGTTVPYVPPVGPKRIFELDARS